MKIDPAERSTDEATDTATATVVDDTDDTDDAATATVVDDTDDADATDDTDADAADDTNVDEPTEESSPGSAITGEAEPLTIGLPDGSESVSEAILSHRQMLTEPSEHGLVSASEAEEVRETVDDLAERVPEELRDEIDALEESVDEMAAGLDRQGRQIRELRDTVASLAEILGASVDFQTLDGDGS